jgi:DNA-binding transcriptional regulator YiaG
MSLAEEARLIRALPDHARAREIREAAGIGVTRLAAELQVSRVTLAHWESGKRRPRGDARLRYARVLSELESVIESTAA